MSCTIVQVVYGVPLNEAVSNKMDEWENSDDHRYYDGGGFKTLYSASGNGYIGYCGVQLCKLNSYGNQCIDELKLVPTQKQVDEAMEMIMQLDPELRKLAGKPGVYFIWSDS